LDFLNFVIMPVLWRSGENAGLVETGGTVSKPIAESNIPPVSRFESCQGAGKLR